MRDWQRVEKLKTRHRVRLTRDKILAESARVFNRCGYAGTTLDDIARVLRVTKAALYYYVRSKDEILFQCHERALDIAMEGVRQAMTKASSPNEQLRYAVAHYIEGVTDQLGGTVVHLDKGALPRRQQKWILERRDEYEGQVRQIIEAGIAGGVFVPCDAKLIGFAIFGAMSWIPRWHSPEGPSSAKEIAEAFSTYLVRGLERHPSVNVIPPASLRGT
jgi:TetR/AcrR family transcriptional regulator